MPADTPRAPRQYKRRTYDEALDLARAKFRAKAASHFSATEIVQLRSHATVGGGSVIDPPSWLPLAGIVPDQHHFYEVSLYEPCPDECSPSPKIWARILVSRDRASDLCVIDWHPPQDSTHAT